MGTTERTKREPKKKVKKTERIPGRRGSIARTTQETKQRKKDKQKDLK